ncbi:PH domain-containing protein [Nocardioides sp. TRM66260-LWL]|uniref:PH domain-containing protein n=1 Tax=Nocardioides sp. TRM66260-LWL TaxID=2874478 RepID=UPI001CC3551B|nr:PH domain-containing protein [Nocardioides sp. TRM66260-LWL]MBZ5734682.1 PH domain-containing protein [Nocardioides sp. TRM66260-LWL]
MSQPAPTLREPAHLVCPRAVTLWRVTTAGTAVVPVVAAGVAVLVWPERPAWLVALAALVVLLAVAAVAIVPTVRYRIHRWEVAGDAVHTRRGLLSVDDRIAPLSRVQTVDSSQGPLERWLRLRSITVTTASAAGPITIEGLDADLAQHLVAELTAITAAERDDAT